MGGDAGGIGGVGGIGGMGAVGGIGGVGIGGPGIAVNIGTLQAPPPSGMAANPAPNTTQPDVVVNISNTAVQALAFETGNLNVGTFSGSKLAEDLAALALLAILERDQQQNGSLALDLIAAATAVNAYAAMQSMGSNG